MDLTPFCLVSSAVLLPYFTERIEEHHCWREAGAYPLKGKRQVFPAAWGMDKAEILALRLLTIFFYSLRKPPAL